MKAMIFAAGLGTRLRPLTDTMPKALVPVAGVPLLERVISKLEDAGYDDIVVNAFHFAEQIDRFVASRSGRARIAVSHEVGEPLETGGGIRHAAALLAGSGRFLVHNVDILSNLDMESFAASVRDDALATLVVSERQTSRYLLFDDEMRLVGWTNVMTGEVKSPYPDLDLGRCRRLAFSGIHIMSEFILELMSEWPERFPIIDFYLEKAADHAVYGYIPENFSMIDVGKVSSLAEAESLLVKH